MTTHINLCAQLFCDVTETGTKALWAAMQAMQAIASDTGIERQT